MFSHFMNGKRYEYAEEPVNPQSDHVGDVVRRMIASDLPNVRADAQARQEYLAREKKRRRDEEIATAKLIGLAMAEE
jgi:hypothetical protein